MSDNDQGPWGGDGSKKGESKESIFIMQISKIIDELICETPKDFYSSNLFKKIKNVVIVGVCKDNADPNKWFFTYCYNFSHIKNKKLYKQFEFDYKIYLHTIKGIYQQF